MYDAGAPGTVLNLLLWKSGNFDNIHFCSKCLHSWWTSVSLQYFLTSLGVLKNTSNSSSIKKPISLKLSFCFFKISSFLRWEIDVFGNSHSTVCINGQSHILTPFFAVRPAAACYLSTTRLHPTERVGCWTAEQSATGRRDVRLSETPDHSTQWDQGWILHRRRCWCG